MIIPISVILYVCDTSFFAEDMLALHRLKQQQQQQELAQQQYDSSLSFASPISSLMLHPAGIRYIDPFTDSMKQQQHQQSCGFPVDFQRQQSASQITPLVVASTAPTPTCGIIGNPLVQQLRSANGFYPPPPDQPLPPLPPTTPVSSNDPGARNSTVNPYAASSLNGFMADDAGMVTSTHTGRTFMLSLFYCSRPSRSNVLE